MCAPQMLILSSWVLSLGVRTLVTVSQRQMLGGQRWWHTAEIPALGRWSRVIGKYQASLGYIWRGSQCTLETLSQTTGCQSTCLAQCQALASVLSPLESRCGDVNPKAQFSDAGGQISRCGLHRVWEVTQDCR